MKNNFIPYTEALALKELGFDDDTLCGYNPYEQLISKISSGNDGGFVKWDNRFDKDVKAPLFQEAFKFFRDKYNLDSRIERDWALRGLPKQYCYVFDRGDYSDTSISYESINYNTYEEAELECLKKLIEIHQIN